jgi:hypothetical protein
MGQDGRFFRDSKRGEVGELRTELANPDIDIMKDAVKKVRARVWGAAVEGAEVSAPRTVVVCASQRRAPSHTHRLLRQSRWART